jgi:hypothetical protein
MGVEARIFDRHCFSTFDTNIIEQGQAAAGACSGAAKKSATYQSFRSHSGSRDAIARHNSMGSRSVTLPIKRPLLTGVKGPPFDGEFKTPASPANRKAKVMQLPSLLDESLNGVARANEICEESRAAEEERARADNDAAFELACRIIVMKSLPAWIYEICTE